VLRTWIEEIALQLALTDSPARGDGATGDGATTGTRPNLDENAFASESNQVKSILNSLQNADKLHVDSIIEGSGLSAQIVLKLLLELELRGVVTQHPGKLFSLAHNPV